LENYELHIYVDRHYITNLFSKYLLNRFHTPVCVLNCIFLNIYFFIISVIFIRDVHRVLVGRPKGKRLLGRSRQRWEDNIKMDLQEIGGGHGDWMELA
jgi:hypothetical protein